MAAGAGLRRGGGPTTAFPPLHEELDAILKALCLWETFELLQRVVLDLADSLAGHAERAADLLERARLLALEPEPQLDHLPLPLRERRERVLDVASRSEEHTSNSSHDQISYAVFCLKKKK